jgi:hypothetical protein
VIQAFEEANKDAKIFTAKWDIKDGFWQTDCAKGGEWNFAYVLPQPEDQLVQIVVPDGMGQIPTLFLWQQKCLAT